MTIQDKIPKNKPYRINEMQVGDMLFTVVSIESDRAREHLYDKVKRMIQLCCLILFKLQLCRRLRILRRSRIVVLQQLAYLAVTRQEHDCPCADLRIDVIVCNAPNQHLIVLPFGYNAGLDKVNIGINSLKEYKYDSVTRGGNLGNVLKSFSTALKLNIDTTVEMLVMNNFNYDELNDFIQLVKNFPITLRLFELMYVGELRKIFDEGYLNIVDVIENMDGL